MSKINKKLLSKMWKERPEDMLPAEFVRNAAKEFYCNENAVRKQLKKLGLAHIDRDIKVGVDTRTKHIVFKQAKEILDKELEVLLEIRQMIVDEKSMVDLLKVRIERKGAVTAEEEERILKLHDSIGDRIDQHTKYLEKVVHIYNMQVFADTVLYVLKLLPAEIRKLFIDEFEKRKLERSLYGSVSREGEGHGQGVVDYGAIPQAIGTTPSDSPDGIKN